MLILLVNDGQYYENPIKVVITLTPRGRIKRLRSAQEEKTASLALSTEQVTKYKDVISAFLICQ